jgi:hypothetical protein
VTKISRKATQNRKEEMVFSKTKDEKQKAVVWCRRKSDHPC